MPLSYNKLWKMLIDKNMKKTDLINMANLSSATLAKMGKDQQVSMIVITRISKTLGCNVGEIMEGAPADNSKT